MPRNIVDKLEEQIEQTQNTQNRGSREAFKAASEAFLILATIVRRMPMSADGVPLACGDHVYYFDAEEDPWSGVIWEGTIESIASGLYFPDEYSGTHTVGILGRQNGRESEDILECGNLQVYATRKAVETVQREHVADTVKSC